MNWLSEGTERGFVGDVRFKVGESGSRPPGLRTPKRRAALWSAAARRRFGLLSLDELRGALDSSSPHREVPSP
jgi:hypothetical protein